MLQLRGAAMGKGHAPSWSKEPFLTTEVMWIWVTWLEVCTWFFCGIVFISGTGIKTKVQCSMFWAAERWENLLGMLPIALQYDSENFLVHFLYFGSVPARDVSWNRCWHVVSGKCSHRRSCCGNWRASFARSWCKGSSGSRNRCGVQILVVAFLIGTWWVSPNYGEPHGEPHLTRWNN